MNISNSFRGGNYSAYSVRNNAPKVESQPPVSNPTSENKSVSFCGRSPLINLMILDAMTTPPSRPKKKPEKSSENTTSSGGTYEYRSDDIYEKNKNIAADSDIYVKDIKKKYLMGPSLVTVEIDGKDYKLYTHASDMYDANSKAAYSTGSGVGRKNSSWHSAADTLPVLIRNIKDQHRGRFVREGDKEIFVPFVADHKPDITKDDLLMKHGNDEFAVPGAFSYLILEPMTKALGKEIDSDKVRAIEYVEKMGDDIFPGHPKVENDNVERKCAYAYLDELTGEKVLYFRNQGEPKYAMVQDEFGEVKTIDFK